MRIEKLNNHSQFINKGKINREIKGIVIYKVYNTEFRNT